MTLTNAYCTLAEARQRILSGADLYVSTGISFASGTKTIADTGKGLARFQTGDRIQVSGSTSNDGFYTVATGNVAASIVVSESLTTEAAGDTVTVADQTDVTDDAIIESVVEAVSRWIDNDCGRRFYRNGTDESRYYTAEDGNLLLLDDDLGSLTSLLTDEDGDRTYETTWSATDYDLEPYNAALDDRPYTRIRVTPQGIYAFPTGRKGVKITGKFGYSATAPKPVKEACLLLTARLFKRKDALFGVMGSIQTGMIRITDYDVDAWRLLRPYVKMDIGAI